VMLVVVGATWLMDRSPEAARAGAFLESARRAALAGTGHEAAPGDQDRQRLRASGNVDEDDSALEAYNALLARLNAPDRGK
jgi:hypothetical protein